MGGRREDQEHPARAELQHRGFDTGGWTLGTKRHGWYIKALGAQVEKEE